jgi:hypothetical protein
MTDTKPTIDEQMASFSDPMNLMDSAIYGSLIKIKQIESAEMPVEPDAIAVFRNTYHAAYPHKDIVEYIDALKAVIQRKDAEARLRLEENAKLHGGINDAEQAAGKLQRRAESLERDKAALIAENEGLRKDAETLNKLFKYWEADDQRNFCKLMADLRAAAIDNAMDEEGGK